MVFQKDDPVLTHRQSRRACWIWILHWNRLLLSHDNATRGSKFFRGIPNSWHNKYSDLLCS